MKYDITNHLKHFPNAAIWESGNYLCGWWLVGNNYQAAHGYYGEYPPSYIERVMTLFPGRRSILHLFSGQVNRPHEISFDINRDLNPDVDGDVRNLSNYFARGLFDLIMADPPYSKKDADKYGYSMPGKNIVFQQMREIIADDGVAVWLDTSIPMYRRKEWRLAGLIGLHCGTNRKVRCASIFEPVRQNQKEESCPSTLP